MQATLHIQIIQQRQVHMIRIMQVSMVPTIRHRHTIQIIATKNTSRNTNKSCDTYKPYSPYTAHTTHTTQITQHLHVIRHISRDNTPPLSLLPTPSPPPPHQTHTQITQITQHLHVIRHLYRDNTPPFPPPHPFTPSSPPLHPLLPTTSSPPPHPFTPPPTPLCLVGENLKCPSPTLQKCEGLRSYVRLRPCTKSVHTPPRTPRTHPTVKAHHFGFWGSSLEEALS